MRGRFLILAFAFMGTPFTAGIGQDLKFAGQVRPRFEFREPVAGGGSDGFTSMRTRLQLSAALERAVSVFIQVQDVRLWGEESNTLGDFTADALDLHQGYLELRTPETGRLWGRAGRQETNFGGQRLVGAVAWAQQARSFDGVRLGARGEFGTVDIIAYKLAEATDPDITADADFAGVYAVIANVADGTLDLYGLYDRVAAGGTKRGTFGARLNGKKSTLSYRFEASYQLGDQAGLDIRAFMLGARVGKSFADGRGSLTLWYDYLSGDDDPTDNKTKVFDTLFPTNHKFYGFADLFLNIPVHTAGLGLQDLAVKGAVNPRPDVRLALDVHHFRAAKTGALTSGRFGEEIDLTARYAYSSSFTVTGGFSYVIQGPAWADIGRLTENMTWMYLMLDAKF